MSNAEVFQVQRRAAKERSIFPDAPWSTERRFVTLLEAKDYIRSTPVDWTECQIVCDPEDVQVLLLDYWAE